MMKFQDNYLRPVSGASILANAELLITDLRQQFAQRRAVVFVGAGVSMSACKGNPLASWKGLLRDGVGRCQSVVPGLPTGWAARVLEEIASDDMDDVLSAAEKIARKLDGGEFRRWLRETIGELRALNPEVITAITALGAPVITTNYDDLIEQVTGRRAVSWQNPSEAESVLRGDESGVFHMHGNRTAAEHHHHRHGSLGVSGQNQRHLNVNLYCGVRRIVDMAQKLLSYNTTVADRSFSGLGHFPSYFWSFLGDSSQHLTLEVFDNFGPPLIPPHGSGGHFFAILEG